MTTLTLHHNDERRTYVEHPIEVARRALRAAAQLEEQSNDELGPDWASVMLRMASALPSRTRKLSL